MRWKIANGKSNENALLMNMKEGNEDANNEETLIIEKWDKIYILNAMIQYICSLRSLKIK